MKTSPIRVSENSSIQRAWARCANSTGSTRGVGYRSSRYSQITVLSHSDTLSSTKTGTRRSGLSSLNLSSPKKGTIGSSR